MPQFGWTRLAHLLLVLSVLAALVRLDSSSAESSALRTSERPQDTFQVPAVADSETPLRPERADPATGDNAARRASRNARQETVRAVRRTVGDEPGAVAGTRAMPERSDPPVFYRPGPIQDPAAPADQARPMGPVCGDLGDFPRGSRIVFPLADEFYSSYGDTWGAPRPQGGHEGTDLMTPAGTPEYAVTDGTLVPVAGSNGNGWNTLGGYAIMLEAAYAIGPVRQGDLFYYAHMDQESTLPIGTRVRAGQVLGYAGDTGQGPEVTRGLFPPHLHFGWYDASGGRSALASGAMNPFPLLEWIKGSGGAVTGGTSARYCEAPQGSAPVPAAGGPSWPAPESPGSRPDLNTGSDDPRPSPVAEKSKARARSTDKAQKPDGARKPADAKRPVPERAPQDPKPEPTGSQPDPKPPVKKPPARPPPAAPSPPGNEPVRPDPSNRPRRRPVQGSRSRTRNAGGVWPTAGA